MDDMDSTDDGLFDVEAATDRKCTTCGVVRPIAMFYVASEQRESAKQGFAIKRPCRLCQRDRNNRRKAPRLAILDGIKAATGCVDCGLKDPAHPEIYDLDHIPGVQKLGNIATFLTKGTVEDMLAEVAKCQVVCANCHRIRTHSREHNSFGRDRGAEHRPWSRAKLPGNMPN